MKNKIIALVLMSVGLLGIIGCATGRANQDKAMGHIVVANAMIKSEMYTEALRELYAAEAITPNDPTIHYYLGVAYHRKDAPDRAIKSFQKAISLKPDYSEAHHYLGIIYMDVKQWDMAIAAFDRALSNILYDNPGISLLNKGIALHQKGDYAKAVLAYQEALRMRDVRTLIPVIEKDMGLSLLALGDYQQALLHFDRAIAEVPDYPEVQYWIAFANVKLKHYDEARRILQDLVRSNAPRSEFAIKANAMLDLMNQGRYHEIKWQP
jgi:tetratricopeptide (TPR) repeat protein